MISNKVAAQSKAIVMKLLSLTRYRSGYVGLIEREETYEWFKLTREGRFNQLKVYAKNDFEDGNHFKSVVAKFISSRNFLSPPLMLERCSIETLDDISDRCDLAGR